MNDNAKDPIDKQDQLVDFAEIPQNQDELGFNKQPMRLEEPSPAVTVSNISQTDIQDLSKTQRQIEVSRELRQMTSEKAGENVVENNNISAHLTEPQNTFWQKVKKGPIGKFTRLGLLVFAGMTAGDRIAATGLGAAAEGLQSAYAAQVSTSEGSAFVSMLNTALRNPGVQSIDDASAAIGQGKVPNKPKGPEANTKEVYLSPEQRSHKVPHSQQLRSPISTK